MSLTGKLSTMSLADLLQWCSGAQKTGRFDFRQGPVVKNVYVQDGVIVGAASNEPTEMLGHVLVARGKLSEEQLRAALLARRGEDEFLGQILVRLGFVNKDDLFRALVERAEEIVYSLFEWEDADFCFELDARPGPQLVLVSLAVDQVLLRGVHRHDEKTRICEVFPDGRVVLAPSDKKPPPEILEHPLARRIFEHLDGHRSIDEVAFLLHASPFPVLKFLHEAYRLGLVKIETLEGRPMMLVTGEAPDTELSQLTGSARAEAALQKLDKGDPEGALALLDDETVEGNPEAASIRDRAEQAFLDKVYQDELPLKSLPELNRPLDELMGEAIRSEEFFVLSRMDGAMSVRDLVEIAPMRESETVRLVRRLVRRGLVRISQPVEASP
jgi:hypothetical protein